MDTREYACYTKILKEQLIPATGCTEPIALAYAAAVGRKTLGRLPEKVTAAVSGSIVKNVKSVVVPATGGMKGIETAIAAGIVVGREDSALEVLSCAPTDTAEKIRHSGNNVPLKWNYPNRRESSISRLQWRRKIFPRWCVSLTPTRISC